MATSSSRIIAARRALASHPRLQPRLHPSKVISHMCKQMCTADFARRTLLFVTFVMHCDRTTRQLPAASVPPAANYVPWVQTGNLVFISGQVSILPVYARKCGAW